MDIQDGHTIGIPSDPINTNMSLRLLESAGIISLNIPDGEIASTFHITEFHVDIEILTVEAGMLANILPDIEAAIINGMQALTAGLYPHIYSILREELTSELREGLTNVLVARKEDIREDGERMRMFRIIADAYHSQEVYDFMWEEFGGVTIPAWCPDTPAAAMPDATAIIGPSTPTTTADFYGIWEAVSVENVPSRYRAEIQSMLRAGWIEEFFSDGTVIATIGGYEIPYTWELDGNIIITYSIFGLHTYNVTIEGEYMISICNTTGIIYTYRRIR